MTTTTMTRTTDKARNPLLRAAILFAALVTGGLIMAAGVAPRLEGFEQLVMLAVGSSLTGAATAFFLVIAFVEGTSGNGNDSVTQHL